MAIVSWRAAIAALIAICATIARAQVPRGDAAAEFPNRPIRIVIAN